MIIAGRREFASIFIVFISYYFVFISWQFSDNYLFAVCKRIWSTILNTISRNMNAYIYIYIVYSVYKEEYFNIYSKAWFEAFYRIKDPSGYRKDPLSSFILTPYCIESFDATQTPVGGINILYHVIHLLTLFHGTHFSKHLHDLECHFP